MGRYLVDRKKKTSGKIAHEWFGTEMLLLLFQHVLNLHWYKALLKGRYSHARILSVAVNPLLLIIILALMGSGIILIRRLFTLSSF